jgi:predicted nucleic acid-binding protein
VSQRLLIDSGVLIALLDSRDTHHAWAREIAAANPLGFASCEAVLTEVFYQIRSSERAKHAVLAMLEAGWIIPLPIPARSLPTITRIIEKYHPLSDYADACLVALHEVTDATVATVDRRDFSIYRTRSNRAVPVILPDLT